MPRTLDPTLQSDEAVELEANMLSRVVGQDRAVHQIVRAYQIFRSGFAAPHRPLSVLLLAGPSGSGKTKTVEALSESLYNNRNVVIKIDCGEFTHGHEIAKLISSPPGYLGHRETPPRISQEVLEAHWLGDGPRLSILLFDEVEKAHDELYQLLLGLLDKASLTLGDNRTVDLSHTMIFLTSNLGTSEVTKLMEGGIGFNTNMMDGDEMDQRIYIITKHAVQRKFAPEFINRLDRIIVFRALTHEHLQDILEIELNKVRERILGSSAMPFSFHVSPEVGEFLIEEGTDSKSGARHLKRAIERHIVAPLSNIVASGQVNYAETIKIEMIRDNVMFIVD